MSYLSQNMNIACNYWTKKRGPKPPFLKYFIPINYGQLTPKKVKNISKSAVFLAVSELKSPGQELKQVPSSKFA